MHEHPEIEQFLSDKRIDSFRRVPVNSQGFILHSLTHRRQQKILEQLRHEEILAMLGYIDPDKATDLLQRLPHHSRKRLLEQLGDNIREKVEFLLKFDPRSAAGLMSLNYVEVNEEATFNDVEKAVTKHENNSGEFPTILVVREGFLVGELPGHAIPKHKKNERIKHHLRHVPHVNFSDDQRQVITVFKHHPHDMIAVLDEKKSIMGVIYSDDLLRHLQKKPVESLSDFAGISDEEDALDHALLKVKHRYKWIIFSTVATLLVAATVSLFQETISAFILLAAYMPVVATLGTSVGTQTLAVIIRSLALHEVEFKNVKYVIAGEMTAGAINGLIVGTLLAATALVFNKSPLLGVIVFSSMVINFILASFFGAVIPLIMQKLGRDPATSATIFLNTLTDVTGFFIFLWLASLAL